jgi:hypothetical protein
MPILETLDPLSYKRLHNKFLHQPTRREKQHQVTMHDPVRSPNVLQSRVWNSNNDIYLIVL